MASLLVNIRQYTTTCTVHCACQHLLAIKVKQWDVIQYAMNHCVYMRMHIHVHNYGAQSGQVIELAS